MGVSMIRRRLAPGRRTCGLVAALAFGAAIFGPTAATAGVSVSIAVPGFWGYYGPPPPPVYAPYYYGYPYGYVYYEQPGPYYWHRPRRFVRHGRRWR